MLACKSNVWCLHLTLFLGTLIFSEVAGQEQTVRNFKKGSYSYFGELEIEDNSFLIDEAFNQEKGVMQFTSNIYWSSLSSNCMSYTFTHEIPVFNSHHQISYTLQYNFNQRFGKRRINGPGDINIGYTYLLAGKENWVMIVPQASFNIPTGDPAKGLGSGGFGGNLGVALTKRLSTALVTHYNFSYSTIYQADYYINISQAESRKAERNITVTTLAGSVIWYANSRFNLMLESVANYIDDVDASEANPRGWQVTSNPGLRVATDLDKTLLVTGASIPVTIDAHGRAQAGIFIYLSVEAK